MKNKYKGIESKFPDEWLEKLKKEINENHKFVNSLKKELNTFAMSIEMPHYQKRLFRKKKKIIYHILIGNNKDLEKLTNYLNSK